MHAHQNIHAIAELPAPIAAAMQSDSFLRRICSMSGLDITRPLSIGQVDKALGGLDLSPRERIQFKNTLIRLGVLKPY